MYYTYYKTIFQNQEYKVYYNPSLKKNFIIVGDKMIFVDVKELY